jgi:hypothetical protein
MRSNEALRHVGNTMSSTLTSGLTDMLDGTKSVSQGFTDMGKAIVRALEEAMIKMLIIQPLMRALGGGLGLSGGGLVGLPLPGAADFIGPIVGKANGGMIRGPGTATSDSIHAMLSNGEYVVKASAVSKHLSLLHAINSDKIPRFADGGLVAAAVPAAPMAGAGNVVSIAPSVAVTVQGSPGSSPAEHAAMGETIARQVGPAIQQMIAIELRSQMRPGGLLAR